MTKYGLRLKKLREAQGLSQEDLAVALNMPRSRLGNYEQGTRQPDFETQEAIADFFNVSLDYLFDRGYDDQKRRLLAYYDRLSPEGQEKAFERMQELIKLDDKGTT